LSTTTCLSPFFPDEVDLVADCHAGIARSGAPRTTQAAAVAD
jgi:predicted protein tyrosine phosphatase